MKDFSKTLAALIPMLMMISGALIIVFAGANVNPMQSNILDSMIQMAWWGWFGMILLIVGLISGFLGFDDLIS